MPVYQLIEQPVFPPLELAEPDGLLALGGDLSPSRLLLAYSSGIFPWYNEGEPILWWSPDPRCIFEPQTLRISRSLAKTLHRRVFTTTFDRAFREVITACARVRRKQGEGTWITGEMLTAFCRLHELGYAHSVECWQDDVLVGGIYGVCLGRCFFGESMFHLAPNASKVALAILAEKLWERDFELIDGQLPNPHLRSLGAREIPRTEFMRRLRRGGVFPSTAPPLTPFP
ncbi:MAG: leucyl/phenylalanyl-tRNA--protein transferase [Desulfuromonadales bacterium]